MVNIGSDRTETFLNFHSSTSLDWNSQLADVYDKLV